METLEVGDDAQGSDTIDDPGFVGQLGKELGHGREPGEDEEQAGNDGKDEADHLIARDGGGHATDGEITARHQHTTDVTAEDDAVVRAAEVVDSDDQGKGQKQRQRQKQPGSHELSDDGLPGGDGHGQQQFQSAQPPFFRPQPHPHRRNQEKEQPRLPQEEGDQRGLTEFEKGRPPDHESEKPTQQQKDHQEHVRHRR